MELNLQTFNFFGSKTYYFNVSGKSDKFTCIYLDGESLDMQDIETYNTAINFIKNCIHCTCDTCDICTDTSAFSFLGQALAKDMESLSQTYNDYAKGIIQALTEQRDDLINMSIEPTDCYCDTRCGDCSCTDEIYCEKCKEAELASNIVETVSNTRTFSWAQKYMDEVIDPQAELTGADYNTLLAMFTQYGEWILNQ